MDKFKITYSRLKLLIIKNKVAFAYGTGILTWILVEAFEGIVGNSAFQYWTSQLKPWLSLQSPLSNSRVVAIGIVGLFIGFLIMYMIQTTMRRGNRHTSIVEQSMIIGSLRNQEISEYYLLLSALSTTVQNSLDNISSMSELDNLIQDYFSKLFLGLGKDMITGSAIIIPDDTASGWLCFWKMNAGQVLSPKRFYIGPEESVDEKTQARGVAGCVYLSNKARIVNILDRASGHADDPDFHRFDMAALNQPRFSIPYDSFICLPIHRNKRIIGVLSIESQKRHSFDAYSIEFLQPIADLLGTIFYISDRIRERQ